MDQPKKNIISGLDRITSNDTYPSIPLMDIYYLLDAQARACVGVHAHVSHRSPCSGYTANNYWATLEERILVV